MLKMNHLLSLHLAPNFVAQTALHRDVAETLGLHPPQPGRVAEGATALKTGPYSESVKIRGHPIAGTQENAAESSNPI